jgi:hypothetical protein
VLDPLNQIIPPGLNSPYGPYGGIPSGNIANSGFAPASGINTGNTIADLALNMAMSGIAGNKPILRTFGRPKVSDYSYTSMQERQRASSLVVPDVISSNPMFGANLMGDLGKNRFFQQAADSFISPGGSMSEAFNTVYGRFTTDLAGPGLRNASTNAILAANVVKNVDKAFVDESGIFDYQKTSGFDRGQTFRNLDAYNRVFGGFTSNVDTRDDVDKTAELADLAEVSIQEAERRGDITPEDAAQKRASLVDAQKRVSNLRTDSVRQMSEFVGSTLNDVSKKIDTSLSQAQPQQPTQAPQDAQTDREGADSPTPERPEAPEAAAEPVVPVEEPQTSMAPDAQPISPYTEGQDATRAPREPSRSPSATPRTEPTTVPVIPSADRPDTAPDRDAPVVPAVIPDVEVSQEEIEKLNQKKSKVDSLTQDYQDVSRFFEQDIVPESGRINGVQSKEIERRLQQIVDEVATVDEETGEKTKEQFNTIKTEIERSVRTATSDAQNTFKQTISEVGTPQQQGLVGSIEADQSSGPMAVLSQQETPENTAQMTEARNKILEINKVVREAQNLFGQEMGLGELMNEVQGLVDNASRMSSSKITDILQKIQATAVVVDMSNEAMVRYFEVMDNMYKGMGVRSGNKANMAQNALLAANAAVEARKETAQARGEAYVGPDQGELAQKLGEYQGRVGRSERMSELQAAFTVLSDEGPQGEIKKELAQRLAKGDAKGASELLDQAQADGRIDQDTRRLLGDTTAKYYEEGMSETAARRLERSLTDEAAKGGFGEQMGGKVYGVLTGEDIDVVTSAAGESAAKNIFGFDLNNEYAQQVNQRLGGDAAQRISQAMESGELSGQILSNEEDTKAKLREMFVGASDEDIDRAEKIIAGAGANIADQKYDVMFGDEERAKFERNKYDREQIDKEIKETLETRSEYMTDAGVGGETARVAFKALQRLQKSGADMSKVGFQEIAAASGGAIKDYLGLSDADKAQVSAVYESMTGNSLEGQKNLREETNKIEADAQAAGQTAVDAIKKTGAVLTPEEEKSIRDEAYNATREEGYSKLRETMASPSGESASADDDDVRAGKAEKSDNFDPNAAVKELVTAIEKLGDIMSKLGGTAVARSDGNPNAVVEQKMKYQDWGIV